MSLNYRSADGDAKRFPGLVAELIRLNVDLIGTRGTPAALAAKNASSTIPVVMMAATALLVVASLARPGGNVTGLSCVNPDLDPKRVELLTELVPELAGIAALMNLSNPGQSVELKEFEAAARSKGLRHRLFDVRQGR